MPIRNLRLTALTALAVLTAAAAATDLPSSALPAPVPAAFAYPSAAPTPPKPRPRPANTCAKGFTKGVIGGVSKCLAPGQRCLAPHAADYTKYGFTCTTVNGVSRLRSKAAAPKKGAAPHRAGASAHASAGGTQKPAPK